MLLELVLLTAKLALLASLVGLAELAELALFTLLIAEPRNLGRIGVQRGGPVRRRERRTRASAEPAVSAT